MLRPAITALAVIAPISANADVLFASGPIYGGQEQAIANCYIYNSEGVAVSITAAKIEDQSGNDDTASTTCVGALAAGHTCTVTAALSAGAHFCSITAGLATALRGLLDIRDKTSTIILTTQDLR